VAVRERRAARRAPAGYQPAKQEQAVAPSERVTGSAADFIPARPTIANMRAAAHDCRGCPLYLSGSQTVFGEGPRTARVLVIGEQPGDEEDKQGKPFVGPSGKLLDRAFEDAGITRSDLYLTNAVKHFKWAREAGGKRRIHKTPSAGEAKACFPWLEMEIKLIRPEVIVCLGATAAKALLGKTFSVMKSRGQPIKSEWAPVVITTVHPSAVLRAPRQHRDQSLKDFLSDLRKVGEAIRIGR
jgi:uracil-DNA glycosylase